MAAISVWRTVTAVDSSPFECASLMSFATLAMFIASLSLMPCRFASTSASSDTDGYSICRRKKRELSAGSRSLVPTNSAPMLAVATNVHSGWTLTICTGET